VKLPRHKFRKPADRAAGLFLYAAADINQLRLKGEQRVNDIHVGANDNYVWNLCDTLRNLESCCSRVQKNGHVFFNQTRGGFRYAFFDRLMLTAFVFIADFLTIGSCQHRAAMTTPDYTPLLALAQITAYRHVAHLEYPCKIFNLNKTALLENHYNSCQPFFRKHFVLLSKYIQKSLILFEYIHNKTGFTSRQEKKYQIIRLWNPKLQEELTISNAQLTMKRGRQQGKGGSRPHAPKVFAFTCGLVLPYGVKQAAKRQAKQCTALFCATPTPGGQPPNPRMRLAWQLSLFQN
jgi:hypothetical protein